MKGTLLSFFHIFRPNQKVEMPTQIPEDSSKSGQSFQVVQNPIATVSELKTVTKDVNINSIGINAFLLKSMARIRKSVNGFFLIKTNNRPLPDPSIEVNEVPVTLTPIRLPNPKQENYNKAYSHFIHVASEGSHREEKELLNWVAHVFDDTWHTNLPVEERFALATFDFSTIVVVIRKLRKKVGFAELAVMILLALIVEKKMYQSIGCKSYAEFFRRNAELLGISPSCARDYYQRGVIFLKYGDDIIKGIGEIPGIPIDDFIASHMAKLTIFDKAVEKLGKEEALICLKKLTFREFQEKVKIKSEETKATKKPSSTKEISSGISISTHDEQKAVILSMELTPNEKRLLKIFSKGGLYHPTNIVITDEQLLEIEKRLRQWRIFTYFRNLSQVPSGFQYKPFDLKSPFGNIEELYHLDNVNDIILRIKTGLALAVPARRAIAILLYRLYIEKFTYESYWKHHFFGVAYSSFKEFAMEELGMGTDYRIYLAVGKVLNRYHYFLNGISDMDTEEVFLKLQYLPAALKYHKSDEPLVLARLRSLTVREFKMFSEMPDFEITFSKRITKKQFKEYLAIFQRLRTPGFGFPPNCNFIEIYHQSEDAVVSKIICEVVNNTGSTGLVCSNQSDMTIAWNNPANIDDKSSTSVA
jgi:hypothetical protein